ncbi:alpha/beta hydrolase [Arcobacter sp. LA11]|uniref:alpha/beta hydrolase n=1 Tax=Arcobacter sp. LA11 TaxID=1898176 RepID=UPI00093383DD|nr:alpha/beta fold hydrolase [Arcobacter sp. LA11]
MLKKILIASSLSILLSSTLYASKISSEECASKGEDFIFAGGECIQYNESEGDVEGKLNIIVHGTWDEGTNTLGRYAPFAETLTMSTDITSVAVALPGYSGSSTNNFTSLAHKGEKNQAAKKEYVLFLGDLVKSLKEKYDAKTVTLVGHSAGAMMSATLSGLKPELVQNFALAGGRYDIHKEEKGNLISMIDVLDSINKNANFLFIYGTNDDISKPEVTTEFFKIAKDKGLNAKLIKVEGAGHIDLDMTDESLEAITSMLEEE